MGFAILLHDLCVFISMRSCYRFIHQSPGSKEVIGGA